MRLVARGIGYAGIIGLFARGCVPAPVVQTNPGTSGLFARGLATDGTVGLFARGLLPFGTQEETQGLIGFPGFGAAVSDLPGLAVPCAARDSYWLSGETSKAPAHMVVRRGLVCTAQADGDGEAVVTAAVTPQAYPAIEVDIARSSVWDVVLVDSFQDTLCPNADPNGAMGDVTHVFMGRGDDGSLVRLNNGNAELGENVTAFLRPSVVAPGGPVARCVFRALHVATETSTGGLLRVTPVIDGDVLTDEQTVFAVPWDTSRRDAHSFRIPLGRTYERDGTARSRQGVVGSFFTCEIEAVDVFGCGRLSLAGLSLEYALMMEDVDGQVYTGESLVVPLSDAVRLWFMGTDEGTVLRGNEGTTDDGAAVPVVARSNEVAFAGVGGEALYECVWLVLFRANASPWTITVTPVVDSVELQGQSIALAGVTAPVMEVIKFPLFQTSARGKGTYLPRGCFLSMLIESDSAPDGAFSFEGWSVQAVAVTVTEGAADA